MAYAHYFRFFTEPCEVRISTMETPDTPVHYYVTLTNAIKVSDTPLENGYVKRVFRLKFRTQYGTMFTMLLEEESNGTNLEVPIHHMYHESDNTKKPHFLFI